MNKYRDFDNYLKEFPTKDGYFGEYGGAFLPPELVPAFEEATNARVDQPPCIIARDFQSFSATVRYTSRERILTIPERISSITAWVKDFLQNTWAKRSS